MSNIYRFVRACSRLTNYIYCTSSWIKHSWQLNEGHFFRYCRFFFSFYFFFSSFLLNIFVLNEIEVHVLAVDNAVRAVRQTILTSENTIINSHNISFGCHEAPGPPVWHDTANNKTDFKWNYYTHRLQRWRGWPGDDVARMVLASGARANQTNIKRFSTRNKQI